MVLTAAEVSKNYRKRNPEKWLESLRKYQTTKWKCPCGLTVTNQCRPRHLKTKTHSSRMELISQFQNNTNEDI